MAVTYTSANRADVVTVNLSWSSDETLPVTFRIYLAGALVATQVSATGIGSYHFHVPVNESPFVEVLDNDCQQPQTAFDGHATLNFLSIPNAVSYKIQQYIGSTWVQQQQLIDSGNGIILWLSSWLSEGIHQFRVIPLDAQGNPGTAMQLNWNAKRHPDPPQQRFSWSAGTLTVH